MVKSDNETLLDVLASRRYKKRYQCRSKQCSEKLDAFLLEVADKYAFLWETTQCDEQWEDLSVLEIGVLTTVTGRCRVIPSTFKSALVEASRENNDLNACSVKGVLRGLHRAHTPKRFLQTIGGKFTKKQRLKYEKRALRSAKSQCKNSFPDDRNLCLRAIRWERANYLACMQKAAKNQTRFSLAMDATEASFKKLMNATMYFPGLKRALWLPPLETGTPKCGLRRDFFSKKLSFLEGCFFLPGRVFFS